MNIFQQKSKNIFHRLQRFVELIHTYFIKEMAMTDNVVGLAQIDPVGNPVDLFSIWRGEAIKFQSGLVNACCLATVSSP